MGDQSVDYYGIEQLLTEEGKLFRDQVRRFVDEECMPVIADHFDKGTFPMKLIPRMAEMGLFGLHAEGYGCKKASQTGDLGSRDLGSKLNYTLYKVDESKKKQKGLDVSIQHISGNYPGKNKGGSH